MRTNAFGDLFLGIMEVYVQNAEFNRYSALVWVEKELSIKDRWMSLLICIGKN